MFIFNNLDLITRKLMVEEIKIAIHSSNIYYSKRMSDSKHGEWNELLIAAAEKYDDRWLAAELNRRSLMNYKEVSRTKNGQIISKEVPDDAAEILASGQFVSARHLRPENALHI